VTLAKYLRRSEVEWANVRDIHPELKEFSAEAAEQVACDTKYAGYVERQKMEVDRQQRLAEKRIPEKFDYTRLSQLRVEAREKFEKVRPASLSQASRISGITPADIALLMVHLKGGK